ncbi:MAG: FAD:protein FMN transferase [Desulfosalsimonadaceae bacterium]|nr:FAD:protein FMN transferase [Desulfosalsimonadaceae bacterium]
MGVSSSNNKKKFSLKAKSAAGLFIIILLTACGMGIRQYNLYRFHLEKDVRLMMDTYVSIYAIGPAKVTKPAIDLAFKRMAQIDAKFSIQNPKSPLYAFNHYGAPVSDKEILHVVRTALEISQKTGGAFDITVCPLIEAWGFYGETPKLPPESDIREAMKNVGYQYLLIHDGILEKTRPGVRIDLGGIAKGYSVGEAAKVLKANGVTSALIDAGGDVYAMGLKGNGPWKVGIRETRSTGLMGYLEAEDIAVIGSGDYERFFIHDGRRYHHIFNPATGYPTEGLSGITIIYSDPMIAQAWAKAPFVLGPEKGLEALQKISGMEVLMVTDSGEKIVSSGLKHHIMQMPKTNKGEL